MPHLNQCTEIGITTLEHNDPKQIYHKCQYTTKGELYTDQIDRYLILHSRFHITLQLLVLPDR